MDSRALRRQLELLKNKLLAKAPLDATAHRLAENWTIDNNSLDRTSLHNYMMSPRRKAERQAMRNDLANDVPTKLMNGQRHFLLHRRHAAIQGNTVEHAGPTSYSALPSHLMHHVLSGGHIHSAWIPESSISYSYQHSPKHYPEQKNTYTGGEGEVIVGPGKYPVHSKFFQTEDMKEPVPGHPKNAWDRHAAGEFKKSDLAKAPLTEDQMGWAESWKEGYGGRDKLHETLIHPRHAADRKKMLEGLAESTKTKMISGEKHFLLHRGHSGDESSAQYESEPTSYTTNKQKAVEFAAKYGIRHGTKGSSGKVDSEWIPEKHISYSFDHSHLARKKNSLHPMHTGKSLAGEAEVIAGPTHQSYKLGHIRSAFEKSVNDQNDLIKMGAVHRLSPFNPQKMDDFHEENMSHWQANQPHQHAAQSDTGQFREAIDPMSREAKHRALNKLGAKTKFRLNQKGEREFLLHRGVSPEEHRATTAGSRIQHEHRTSWTPHYPIAHGFAHESKRKGKLNVHSAWINEKHIVSVPSQYGEITPPLHIGQFEAKPKGVNTYKHEHEVIVESYHNSKRATQKDIDPLKNLNETINMRSPGEPQTVKNQIKHRLGKSINDAAQLADIERQTSGKIRSKKVEQIKPPRSIQSDTVPAERFHGDARPPSASVGLEGDRTDSDQEKRFALLDAQVEPLHDQINDSGERIRHPTQHWPETGVRKPFNPVLNKGLKGDWQKEGYEISHTTIPMSELDGSEPDDHTPVVQVVAHDKHGNEVGFASLQHHYVSQKERPEHFNPQYPSGTLISLYTNVYPEHRRKGIAQAMYEHAEKVTGRKMHPGTDQTPAASALWSQPKRSFGKSLNDQLAKEGMNEGFMMDSMSAHLGNDAGKALDKKRAMRLASDARTKSGLQPGMSIRDLEKANRLLGRNKRKGIKAL